MSQQTTIRKLAELVNTPVDKLLEQLAEAGMKFSGPDQVITSAEKLKLHGFLRRAHGKADKPADEVIAPGKITLNRSRKQEITVGGGGKAGRSASTVEVVTRKKITIKPGSGRAPSAAEVLDAERADALRKLEESRARNVAEQQALAEKDRQRAEELAEIRRREQESAERAAAEATAAAEVALEESGKPKSHAHGHGHAPKPVAPKAPAPKHGESGAPASAKATTIVFLVAAALFWFIGAYAPAAFLGHFTVFVLACFVGYMVIWNVTPSLHTPLMSVTNAISSIIAIGALVQVAPPLSGAVERPTTWIIGLAVVSIALVAINMFGGFAVTQRMLQMFRK